MSGAVPPTPSHELSWRDALRYGALGAPLAFVALPLYVHWPAFAASAMDLSLAALGVLLLAMRVLDALVDPWLGQRVDMLLRRPRASIVGLLAIGSVVVAGGFAALFVAPSVATLSSAGWVAWSIAALGATYVAYSFVQIAHQAWGARLGGDETFRARVVGARELAALAGVVAASVLPTLFGWGAVASVLALLLVLGLVLLARAPAGVGATAGTSRFTPGWPAMVAPLRHAEFRALLGVYALAGLASAIPATLVLFYIRDRLVLPQFEGLFLLAYFAGAAASVPMWTRLVERWGLVHVWAAGMALAITVFVFAAWLGRGEALGFALVCVGSGFALGAQLVAPAALLAGVIRREGSAGQGEGLWFGWWNLCGKLQLALAAGVALPLVQALGYRTGDADAASTRALVIVYALVPCVLQALSLALLLRRRWSEPRGDVGVAATGVS
jgi:Na+/melibiose symporter-like transporter